MKYIISLSGLALLGLVACAPQAELPKTPEEVVKAYQAYYDQNRFEEAKVLSTLAEQKRLDELAKMIREQSTDSTELTTVFLSLNCRIKGDSAFCKCRCKDQYETYSTDYVLLRHKKQWYVDAPKEERYEFNNEDYEGVVDTLFDLLDVEQQKQ